jgi:type IV pilus assembly protein PilQ
MSCLPVGGLASRPAVAGAAPQAAPDGEARISVDVKDADIVDIVRLFAEIGGFQVVVDPGVSCKLTLKLSEVRWAAALDVALKSCGLGQDQENEIVRVAPVARLAAEAAAQRKLDEERSLSGPLQMRTYRLSYARAAEMAPIVKRFLSPRGEVIYDSRTNTLIVMDVR